MMSQNYYEKMIFFFKIEIIFLNFIFSIFMYQTYVYDRISKPNYIKILKDKKGPAKKGNAIAQVEYATACFYGIKINGKDVFKPDLKLATKYATQLSEIENADGLVLYGIMQLTGTGTSQNTARAFNSFYKAINKDSGNRDAQYLLFHLFFKEDFKEIPIQTAINYLIQSGKKDEHTIKQAMGELGIFYYQGKHIEKNNVLALKYLIESAESYPPANKYLKECTKSLTGNEYGLEHFSRPKNIYNAAVYIKEKNGNKVDGIVDQLLKWANKKDYPPAMYDYAILHMSENRGYCEDRIIKAAEKRHLLAINYCGLHLSKSSEQLMTYAKQSIYFKSDYLKTSVAKIYKETCKPANFNLGIYFRYQRYASSFTKDDLDLIKQLKLKAWKDGTNEEKFAYAICLENGFNGLESDVETAVCIYKNLSENDYAPATRNMAHFQEFGEFVYQDLPSAIKKLEQYDDLEAKASIQMMNTMLGDHPIFPFPYSHKINKAKGGYSKDVSKAFTKIAFMLIRNKEMIPNFKLADKILDKAKKKSPLGMAISASICGDARAGKPNSSKAEKMFKEALRQDSAIEIKELYAGFLISEDRKEEAEELDVEVTSEFSTRLRRSTLAAAKTFSTKDLKTRGQLTDGKDLYYNGYVKDNNIRFLERAASAEFPLAQSEYAHYIIKEGKKKEYKKALSYLHSSIDEGIVTSYVMLGYMYHKGLEVKANHQEALKYYSIAIEQLEYQGYAGFALAYCTGHGFDRDFYMANRYITMAKDVKTTFKKPYLIDYQLFLNKDYKNKFDDIKEKDCSGLNPSKASNAFQLATFYEFNKLQYQKAFTFYEKACKLEPDNHKYKRNYAYFIMKGIGSSDNLEKAAKYYKELGNDDDFINLKIVQHYIENPITPYYMSEEANEIFEKIVNEKETIKDYYNLGMLILTSNQVHQQYNLAYCYLKKGAEKYDDPQSYYSLAQMSENGYGGYFTDKEIVLQYTRSALLNSSDKMFTPENAKGCFKFGTMLAHGERIYTDLHQACFYLSSAIDLDLNEPTLINEYNTAKETLITNKNVIDPWDEHLASYYSPNKFDENEFDDIEIKDLSNPYQNWKTYNQSSESSNDPDVLFQVGFQYMKGVGVAKDYNKALEFLAKAVIRDHAQAKVYFAILARMCKLSHYSEMYKFNMFGAKIQGLSLPYVEEAKVELGLYENISKGDVEKAQELLQVAIDAGDTYALYIRGRYLDDAQALKEAAEKGCAKANYYIAKMMIGEHQYDEAYPMAENGALHGHPKAIFMYGYLNLLRGEKQKAEELLSKGAKMAGNSIIAVKYGLEKLKGNKIDKNEEEAFQWFEYAHNMNNLDGTLNLAICLRDGIGCQQDIKKASILFKIGCKLKIPEFYSQASQCFKELKGVKNWFKEKKYGKKAKKVKSEPPQFPDRIIKPPCQIDTDSIYNPRTALKLARNNKMVDNNKYKNHLITASKLGLFGAVKEMIYQLLSGFYFEEDDTTACSLTNHLIAVGWATGYKILGDIYYSKEIFFHKDKTFEAYKKASEMGSKSGKFKYGYCIAHGIGCEKNSELGNSIIDSSDCKYAYNYLKTYTKYKPKNAKPNSNCLTVLEKVSKVPISFEYRYQPAPVDSKKKNKKQQPPPLTMEDIRILVEKDIKYGIIMYNKYCWDNKCENQINPSSMSALENVCNMGSSFGNYQYGYTLYKRGKLADCIKYLKFAADRDNYYACHFVGRALYDDSIGQYSLAKVYLKKSAIQLNDADDQYDLAFMSENNEAIDWLEMAVKNDKNKYCLKVADLFRNGIKGGLNPNSSKAAYYYTEAKYIIRNSDDFLRVGRYFLNGDGVPKRKNTAYEFFEKAADYGSDDGAALVCIMYENGEVSGYSFPESCYIKAANANRDWSSHFCWNLAVHYYRTASNTSVYDHERAAKYFEKCGTAEGRENARIIRQAIEEYERRQREIERLREQQRENEENKSSGGGGLLLAVGIGVALVTGLPLF